MDRNTTIGLVLIFAVLVVFSYINRPSQQQIEAAKRQRDSIELVKKEMEQQMAAQKSLEATQITEQMAPSDTLGKVGEMEELKNLWGDFGVSAKGEEEIITLENNLMRIFVSTKGGRIQAVELKNYKRHDSSELFLIEADKSTQNLTFFAQNRNIQTDNFYFIPSINETKIEAKGPEVPVGREGRVKYNEKNPGESKTVSLKLMAGENAYIEYLYTIKHNSFELDYQIKTAGMQSVINASSSFIQFNFGYEIPRQERQSAYGEDRYTTIYYKFRDAEIDHLSKTKSDSEDLKTPVKWIGFKQLFFSTTIQSSEAFPNALVTLEKRSEKDPYLAHVKAEMSLPYDKNKDQDYKLSFYFGPNHYQTLKQLGENKEKLIDLGWPVVREVNRYLIIPVFNFLRRHIDNFGLIILILTILIKVIVFPFTYKSYVSQAKMRALKPEIDEINKKYPADKAMEKQQATMNLYKKAGVNPLGGCLPMLFQMPVLIAMFYFFPGSIELRQESFLWAKDLSTYDSILNLPFNIPMYGSHVSLFTLLMTITTILQTRMSGQTQDTSAMPGMKTMMYIMPIFFMFILNSYSAGLSYYYFLANVITIGQTYVIRGMIDEKKLHAQIQLNKKKPVKKSGFQARLEEMARKQGVNVKK